jgi:hypothetical protein
MSNFIALALLVLIIAIPAAAVVGVYRIELSPVSRVLRRLFAFDPRHPALAYEAAADRIGQR